MGLSTTNRAFAVFLCGLVLLSIPYEAILWKRQVARFDLQPNGTASFDAQMSIGHVQYRGESAIFEGQLTVEITARRKQPIEPPILISYRPDIDEMSTTWLHGCDVQYVFVSSDGDDTNDDVLPGVVVDCGVVQIGQMQPADEWKYPFDSHSFKFSPGACVGERECMPGSENVALSSLRVSVAERNFMLYPDTAGLSLTIRRPPVVRTASVALFLVAGAFVLNIWGRRRGGTLSEAFTKALGLFGALWAFRVFLVPASVHAFPTLVDYSTLALFVIFFAGLLYRIERDAL